MRHRAPEGSSDVGGKYADRPQTVVVGGGIAGLAAAVGLAERGVRVTVVEREQHLGGRVGSWTETTADGRELAMGRGFHAFFRQYYNLRALLRRADAPLRNLTPLVDYPLVDECGRYDSFRRLPRTPPWNALAFVVHSSTFRVRDLLSLDMRSAAPLAAVSVPEIYEWLDEIDADTFLRRINFPAAARHLAFDVFSRSFFAEPAQMSSAELAMMFHIYFLGSSEGLLFDVPSASFDVALWSPLRTYLTGLGVTFRMGAAVTGVDVLRPGRFRVRTESGVRIEADAVVLAADVPGLRDIVAASPDLGDRTWREQIGGLRTAPPFLVQRLWLDRPVAVGRPGFLATGGLPPLDNISVLNRYEEEAMRWAARNSGSVLELHAYAATPPANTTEADHIRLLRQQLTERLQALYPETADARVVAESVQWRADCPLLGVGDFARRPRVRSPFRGLVLAGDGIRIDLPVALMERAASTGWHAANCLLAGWGLAGHVLHSVPTTGRTPLLRWLALRTLGSDVNGHREVPDTTGRRSSHGRQHGWW